VDLIPYEAVKAEMARRRLSEFVRQAWPIIEPSTPLVWNWHLDVICDHVQALVEGRLVRDGRVMRNLIINVPPGSMKSTILSVCLPPWIWLQNPGEGHDMGPAWRGVFASGNGEVAIRDSIKCRDILDSAWYRRAFAPKWSFTRDQNAKGHYKNSNTGFRRAISAGSKITGSRSHAIIVDDPNDAAEAYSKPARDAIINWWDNAAANRLANMSTGVRCIIQQRLHEEDLTGHILATDPEEWEVLIIREEYEHPKPTDPDCRPTSLGWTDPRTVEGELFFPARFPLKVLESEKRRLGSAGYAGQHQQRPTPAAGLIFLKGFVRTFVLAETQRKMAERDNKGQPVWKYKRIILSGDTAFKEKEENDFSVVLAVGERAEGYDLLDRWKDKAGYPELKLRVKALNAQWRPQAFLIEDKASGQSLLQELRLESSIPIVPIKVDTDKVSRAHAVVPTWEAGNVFVDPSLPWVADFLDNMYGFPKMAHDDDVDAFTQALNYLHHGFEGQGVVDYYTQLAAKMVAEGKTG
jgi:predicted phage terminase large subunit-like protein